MTSELLKKHAARAADEIERRGWVRGDLAERDWLNEPLADCKVCVLGGLGVSYFGNPLQGMNDGVIGAVSGEYEDMLAELADIVFPGWVHETDSFDDGGPMAPVTAVYTWNDELAETGDVVIEKLREIAAR